MFWARIYAGFHFYHSLEDGRQLGESVAKQLNRNYFLRSGNARTIAIDSSLVACSGLTGSRHDPSWGGILAPSHHPDEVIGEAQRRMQFYLRHVTTDAVAAVPGIAMQS